MANRSKFTRVAYRHRLAVVVVVVVVVAMVAVGHLSQALRVVALLASRPPTPRSTPAVITRGSMIDRRRANLPSPFAAIRTRRTASASEARSTPMPACRARTCAKTPLVML